RRELDAALTFEPGLGEGPGLAGPGMCVGVLAARAELQPVTGGRDRVERLPPRAARLTPVRSRYFDRGGRVLWEFDVEHADDALGITRERSEEHTSELQSRFDLVCRLLLEKKKKRSTKKNT